MSPLTINIVLMILMALQGDEEEEEEATKRSLAGG